MDLLSKSSLENLVAIQNNISEKVKGAQNLENAAQEYMSILYNRFAESIVLARFYVTVPFKNLPETNRQFVTTLAQAKGINDLIKDETLVLSLLGTRGQKDEWNDRKKSKGHVGIPLASADFIDKIPMMSRLLKQLGAELNWINSNDTGLVAKTFKNVSGVFYVRDAKAETDTQGRKIIAAQDFVEEFGVKTVFGIGGCYLGTATFFTTIIFLRETIEKELAERFMLQANKFKTATNLIVEEEKVFN